ncbi:MAG: amino acid adenylation domain-containing protein [Oscillospiraceae bacterium]|nr:amino acid adenylation domain-containing protein [Oscillospiraceae bacterium]
MDYPLTKPQRRIYDLERFAAGAAGIACSILFIGALDEPAMQRALGLIVETNDALRLRVTPQARQYFAPYEPERFPVRAFAGPGEFHAWAAQKALGVLDMHGKPYEFTIVVAGDRFGLFLRLHHIAADAWSVARLASLLHQYYHDPRPLESPSYGDCLEKQEAYLQSGRFARDRAFWLSQFPGRPEPCFLAKQSPNAPAAARWDVFLTPEQARPLRDFAGAHQLSLFNLLLTAMAAYLCRLRGQTRLCLGTTTLGRPDSVLKRTLGMFAGTLPLPVQIDPEAGFCRNALAGKERLFAAVRHEGFGYTDLLGALKERDGFEGRLYDVLVNYQNAAVTGMDGDFDGTYWYFCGAQPEALQIQANDRDNTGGLFLSYDYQLAAFAREEIQLLHERLMTLLRDAAAHPDKPVSRLELLCGKDREAWEALNKSGRSVDLRPVHAYFEEQAAARPGREAVIFGEQRLSYGQLNDWANRIAGWLRAKGVAPGQVVALRMERRLELMPLIFGIMKAGCAYLPMLPAWPEERVRFILEDAKAALLVAEKDLPALHGLPDITIESSAEIDLAAYVMYTSGSTGQPKGVRVGQAGLCNRLLWMEDAYPLAQGEILIQKTSYAFDVSAWELFWPFMQGRALLLPEPGAERDPRRLAELICRHGIRTIHFVPSMLSLFLDYLASSGLKLPSLERVVVSGEALTPALNRRFYGIFAGTGTRLHNLYGPTECTVDVLYYDCAPGDAEIPIGRPVWNTGAWVLDPNGMPLPPGETGELCITGVQLAYGYADPALDENRFVAHPALGRMYKTGDLCSLRADGQVLYHGRGDGQVKIRGQRVELAEIERQLEQAPGVARAAVVYDGARLYAFVCAAQGFDEAAALLYLSARLPSYMLPERVLRVPEFPLNANGKLDRKRLAGLAGQPPAMPAEAPPVSPPVTQQERQLMAAVRAHGGAAGMDDAPSRCGLSSLDIVGVTIELEAQGLRLQVNDFYTAPDFRKLAALMTEDAERPLLFQLTQGAGGIACVGVPYGGGGFAAWADVARALPLPFYAVTTAHEDPEILLRALGQLPHERFVLLGSCVGSGLAAALAQRLEMENRLAGLCILASAPPSAVWLYGRWFNPWLLRGPAATNRALQKLSEKELRLGTREIAQLRGDAAWFLRFLAGNSRVPLRAPIQLMYGADDPMLRHTNVKRRWERFFGRLADVLVIPGAKHDIVHTHPEEIAGQLAARVQ